MCAVALGVLVVCLVASRAGAAPGDLGAAQVADINPGGGDSSPGDLVDIDGTLLFGASDGANGRELWKSTGTGVAMVDDIAPAPGEGSSPDELTDVDGTLFFAADDGTDGTELWKSVAPYTTAIQVADINPGGGSDPKELINVDGTLFFAADDGVNGRELWTSDGGPLGSGTEMVDDINPGGGDSSPFDLTAFASFNGTLAFAADDGTDGEELWKSDGNTATQVDDINPGGDSSSPGELTDLDGSLFFAADGGADGKELWTSDGNTAFQVADIRPAGSSSPDQLTNVDGTLFFRASDGVTGFELWRSDGGPLGAGTDLVADIRPGANSSSSPTGLTNVDGTVFFDASDGTNGFELWRSDGGPLGAGTEMVADINPSGNSGPDEITDVGGTLFFAANDGTHGRELWSSPGTGATMVADIDPAAGSGSFPRALTDVAGTLFFAADDGSEGDELWRTTIEGPNPPPPPDAAPDTEIAIEVDAKRRQRVGKLKLEVSCAGEPCDVDASGKAVAKRAGGKAAAAAKKKTYKLKPVSTSLDAGEQGTVRLKLKRHTKSVKKLRKLLKDKPYRKRSKAKVEVVATDAAGNTATETAEVKLRR